MPKRTQIIYYFSYTQLVEIDAFEHLRSIIRQDPLWVSHAPDESGCWFNVTTNEYVQNQRTIAYLEAELRLAKALQELSPSATLFDIRCEAQIRVTDGKAKATIDMISVMRALQERAADMAKCMDDADRYTALYELSQALQGMLPFIEEPPRQNRPNVLLFSQISQQNPNSAH